MTGSEQTIDGSLAKRAQAWCLDSGNVDPHGFVRIWNASQAGDFAGAVAAQKQLFKLEPIVRTGNAARMGPARLRARQLQDGAHAAWSH
ncbi:MAG: hypothetical protein R2845_00090 [Thermomicrobiales bacterium]